MGLCRFANRDVEESPTLLLPHPLALQPLPKTHRGCALPLAARLRHIYPTDTPAAHRPPPQTWSVWRRQLVVGLAVLAPLSLASLGHIPSAPAAISAVRPDVN